MRPNLRIIQGDEPKLKYRLPDGRVVVGDTPLEVVQAMSDDKMSTPRSLLSYRTATARRIHGMTGRNVATKNNKSFLASLVLQGFLEDLRATT